MYYKKFFDGVELLEGFCNTKTISHPSKNDAIETYKERLHYKSKDNRILCDLAKYKLITMHSSTNPKNFKSLF